MRLLLPRLRARQAPTHAAEDTAHARTPRMGRRQRAPSPPRDAPPPPAPPRAPCAAPLRAQRQRTGAAPSRAPPAPARARAPPRPACGRRRAHHRHTSRRYHGHRVIITPTIVDTAHITRVGWPARPLAPSHKARAPDVCRTRLELGHVLEVLLPFGEHGCGLADRHAAAVPLAHGVHGHRFAARATAAGFAGSRRGAVAAQEPRLVRALAAQRKVVHGAQLRGGTVHLARDLNKHLAPPAHTVRNAVCARTPLGDLTLAVLALRDPHHCLLRVGELGVVATHARRLRGGKEARQPRRGNGISEKARKDSWASNWASN